MELQDKINMSKNNIRQALKDYRLHDAHKNSVIDNVSENFIEKVAMANATSKNGLRELFRKSPCWNEELDALIINGTHTHNPDPDTIAGLESRILRHTILSASADLELTIREASKFFWYVGNESGAPSESITALNSISPKAYKKGRKTSRIFRQFCVDLGLWDETPGSEFQALYAKIADEFTTRKIPYKLFVSVNPAHFITMSNPKYDERGCTLTSCHSFNSEDYTYNNGCVGYACDKYSFIVFTVSNPCEPELLNNRKTTRQIFAYKPYNGVLLQSRLYNTSGGTSGAQEESKEYRDLIQREIANLESKVNLWKTQAYPDNSLGEDGEQLRIEAGMDFGGYTDWIYENFNPKISVMVNQENPTGFLIGVAGRCIVCGCPTSKGLYCRECKDDREICDDCGNYCEALYEVYDEDGNRREVCYECRENSYTECVRCNYYYPDDSMVRLATGEYVCDECCLDYYTRCDICGEYYENDFVAVAFNEYYNRTRVCSDCLLDSFVECTNCGEYIHTNISNEVNDEEVYCGTCFEKYNPRAKHEEDDENGEGN